MASVVPCGRPPGAESQRPRGGARAGQKPQARHPQTPDVTRHRLARGRDVPDGTPYVFPLINWYGTSSKSLFHRRRVEPNGTPGDEQRHGTHRAGPVRGPVAAPGSAPHFYLHMTRDKCCPSLVKSKLRSPDRGRDGIGNGNAGQRAARAFALFGLPPGEERVGHFGPCENERGSITQRTRATHSRRVRTPCIICCGSHSSNAGML
jgi:hypothetical protein